MQQLQQAQANLNQQLRDATAGAGNASLMQAQLQQQLGNFGGGLGANFNQLGGGNMVGFGSNLGGAFGNLSNLGSNIGQLGGGNHIGGGPSMLDVQRAENFLGAMTANAGMQGMGQLSSLMNQNQAALLQSRLNGSIFGQSSSMPMSQDSLINKNHSILSSLAAANQGFNNGGFNPLGQQIDQEIALAKRRRSLGETLTPLRKASQLNGVGMANNPEMATAAEIVAMEDIHSSRKAEPKSRRKAKSFPVKLMSALIENSSDDVIAWLPDGKSFVIVNPDLFVDTILSKTFKECKYASFVRKLHRWGFVRLTSGTGTDCFHHPLFQRNRTDLCARIVCTPRDPLKASESESEKRVAVATSMTNDKPPSLAGVEKFFKSRPCTSQSDAGEKIENEEHELENEAEKEQEHVVANVSTSIVVPTAAAAV